MNKQEYLAQLETLLQDKNPQVAKEIMDSFHQHFQDGLASGYQEEEIIEGLGSVEELLQELQALPSYEEEITSMVLEVEDIDLNIAHHAGANIIDFEDEVSDLDIYNYDFEKEVVDGVLSIKIKRKKKGIFLARKRATLSLFLPSSMQYIKIHSESGDVEISDVSLHGLVVDMGFGDLALKELEVEKIKIHNQVGDSALMNSKGNVILESKSGDVYVKDMQGDTMQLTVTSGDVEIEHSQLQHVIVKSTSGDIELNHITAVSLDGQATSGDVELMQSNMQEVVLQVKSGDIQVEKSVVINAELKSTCGDIEFDGSCTSIKASGASGDICLDVKEVKRIEADTKMGDVEISLHGKGYVADLETVVGDIEVYGDKEEDGSYYYGSQEVSISVATTMGDICID